MREGFRMAAPKLPESCSWVMVGRAAIGNPFIFREIKCMLAGKEVPSVTYEERVAVCLKHLRDAAAIKGERPAVLEMRKQYGGYFKGIPHFKETKLKLMAALTVKECEEALKY